MLFFGLDMLVLQAIARPRVGGVFLYTIYFHFPNTGRYFLKKNIGSFISAWSWQFFFFDRQ